MTEDTARMVMLVGSGLVTQMTATFEDGGSYQEGYVAVTIDVTQTKF